MQALHRALVVASLLTVAALSACSKPKPVQVTPRAGQVTAIGPSSVLLTVLLDVHNPNSFGIRAREVKGVLELQNGSELGRGSALPAAAIPARATATVPAQLDLRWTNLAQLAPYALSGKPVPYRIRGTAKLGGESLNVEVPFAVEGELTREQVIEAGLRGVNPLGLPR